MEEDIDNGSVSITHVTGEIEVIHPSSSCHQDNVAKQRHKTTQRHKQAMAESGNNAIPDGWYDNAYIWHYIIDEHVYKSFKATYTVPTNPRVNKDQTLYYFIGLQDEGENLNILQPVLAWGDNFTKWSVRSWACCPQNITFRSAALQDLAPHDEVDVAITRDDASTWRIDSRWKDKNVTLDARIGNYFYNYADVTLETYRVKSCDELAGPVKFSKVALVDQNGIMSPPPWQITKGKTCNGGVTVDKATGDITMH